MPKADEICSDWQFKSQPIYANTYQSDEFISSLRGLVVFIILFKF